MKTIGNIHLVWRPGRGSSRISVGIIKKSASGIITFKYNKKGIEEAKKIGFVHYEGFPNTEKIYTENVIEIFGQRLIRSERPDLKEFYDFWKIDLNKKEDKYYMLAYTQGLLPTDNFEFLTDFYPRRNLTFITEITGLRKAKFKPDLLSIGNVLSYKLDSKNLYDKKAVDIYKGNLYLGRIKLIHSRVFHKTKFKPNLKVQAIEKNGVLNRIFVEVKF